MKNYFVLDFYCQTESGLKKDIKQSGVDNIDPWEDMEEDSNLIESYLFPKINLIPIEHVLLKVKTKYILRFLCESNEDIKSYLLNNKDTITEFVSFGWSPFSQRGIPFKFTQISKKETWDIITTDSVELSKSLLITNQIYTFK